jgi:hypothetical protein
MSTDSDESQVLKHRVLQEGEPVSGKHAQIASTAIVDPLILAKSLSTIETPRRRIH